MGNQKEAFFTVKDSICYAGVHFLLELRGFRNLDSLKGIEKVLGAVKATKAHLPELKHTHKAVSVTKKFFSPKNATINKTIKIPVIIPKINYCAFMLASIHNHIDN